MACSKRPYFCVILLLSLLALSCHLVGFVAPGWLMMRLSVMEETRQTTLTQIDLIGSKPEVGPTTTEIIPERKRRSETDVEVIEVDVVEESAGFKEWISDTVIEINTFDLSVSYGLWFSTVCIHDKETKVSGPEKKDGDSSEEEDGHHKKRHCTCRKISTKCALYNSFIFEDPIDYINPGGPARRVLSPSNFGYASLLEQRLENCLTLAFLSLGLLSAFGGFRKSNSCRCAGVACIMFMMLAAFITLVPVARFGHYSIYKKSQGIPVQVHVPYSVIASGLGAVFALVTAMVAGCALAERSRLQKPGRWYQFNNELEFENEKEKKPALVFIAEALPEKPGLNDKEEAGVDENEKEPIA